MLLARHDVREMRVHEAHAKQHDDENFGLRGYADVRHQNNRGHHVSNVQNSIRDDNPRPCVVLLPLSAASRGKMSVACNSLYQCSETAVQSPRDPATCIER